MIVKMNFFQSYSESWYHYTDNYGIMYFKCWFLLRFITLIPGITPVCEKIGIAHS